MKTAIHMIAIFLLCLTGSSGAQPFDANITNTGDPDTGWRFFGLATDPGGGNDATIQAPFDFGGGTGGVSAATAESAAFFNLPSGRIQEAAETAGHIGAETSGNPVGNISGFYHNFSGQAGDVITFDSFFQLDNSPTNADYSFGFLLGPSGLVPAIPAGTGFNNLDGGSDPVLNFTPETATGNEWTLPEAGDYTIGFAILHTRNTPNQLGNLTIENMSYSPVPEINASAAALPLAALGMILLIIGDVRRRKAMMDA